MTTMTIAEELGKLGSVTAAELKKEAVAQSVFRPETRPAVVSGHGRVQIVGRDKTPGTRKDGSTYPSDKLVFRFSNLTNVKVHRTRPPFTESSFEYSVGYYETPGPNSELGMMIAALGGQSTINDLIDVECDFEEIAIPPPVDKDGNVRLDSDGFKMKARFYYRCYNLSGTTAEPTPTATVEGEEIACVFASGKTDSELSRNDFLQGFIKAGGTDSVVQTEIAAGTFLKRMVSEGKLEKLLDGSYSLVTS